MGEVKTDLKCQFRWVYGSLDRNRFPTERVFETEVREQRRRVRRKRVFSLVLILLMALIIMVVVFDLIPSFG